MFFYILPSFAETNSAANTASYSSSISKKQNNLFFEKIKNKKINRLMITSSGGEVDAAIKLALWVFENNIDIEVPEYCLSSCANYIFTAARNKIIHEGAVVAWHGNYHHLKITGLWRDDINSRMNRTGESRYEAQRNVYMQMTYLVNLERKFFARIGVDERICWIGKMSPYNITNYYFLSVDDMSRFGVKNVTAPKGYENTNTSRFEENIEYLKIK